MEYETENFPITLTVPEIAEILRINKTKAYELTHQDDFPSIKVGKRIIVPRDPFLQWLNNCGNI